MLSPEEAKLQLKQFENPNGYLEAGVRVNGFWSKLKDIGADLLEGAERTHGGWNAANQEKWESAKKAFEELDDKDRLKLLNAIFPGIGHYVDASWQAQKRGTYQTGYLRRAFRAPHSPGVTKTIRTEWLVTLMRCIIPYRYDLDFLCVWAPHLRWGSEPCIGLLLAAVLDSNSRDAEATYATLSTILRGEHTIGRIARHLTTAMLVCSRPDAWESIERLLLAAQRQEGLRQVVLETIDFAHPQAFLRMLRLIEREKLSRFAAVTRAVAVWFGMSPDSSEAKWLDKVIVETAENLESAPVRQKRLESADGQTVYLAIWSIAFYDAEEAAKAAEVALARPEFEVRYAATRLLCQLGISTARPGLTKALAAPDLRIAIEAAEGLTSWTFRNVPAASESAIFDAMAALVDRTPKKKSLGSVIWDWNKIEANQGLIAEKLVPLRANLPWSRVTAYLPVMSASGRHSFALDLIAVAKKSGDTTQEMREIALSLLADTGTSVRTLAFQLVEKAQPSPEEAEGMERLLSRTSSDLRRGVIRLLLNQPRQAAQASANRLAASGDPKMKEAADELVTELTPKPVAESTRLPATSPLVPPKEQTLHLLRKGAAPQILRELDILVASKREERVSFDQRFGGRYDDLLGNIRYLMEVDPEKPFPLAEVWTKWWDERSSKLEDKDGLALARAAVVALLRVVPQQPKWQAKAIEPIRSELEPKFPVWVNGVIQWLLLTRMPDGAIPNLLDSLEGIFYWVSKYHEPAPDSGTNYLAMQDWQATSPFSTVVMLLDLCRKHVPSQWTQDDWIRYWRLLRWFDQGTPGKYRHSPPLETIVAAHQLGVASDADLYVHLIGGDGKQSARYGRHDFSRLTRRKRDKLFDQHPPLQAFVEDCRDRVLEIELKRGDLSTPYSEAALAMKAVSRPGLTLRVLKLLGRAKFTRGYNYDSGSKTGVHSHLLRISLPSPAETREAFRDQAAELGIRESRLVDLAIYAPQWAPHVEFATGIKGLETVAFWLHAHTKDQYWEVDEQIRELWFAEVSERTPLSKQDLLDGAVDVEWFRGMYAEVGAAVWQVVLESAKYASSSGGHKRAELFGSALLGETTTEELIQRIDDKRHQDSVRALGLVPLGKSPKAARQELLARYELLQRFIKESRQFGSQRQASEKLAAEIGLANLARTAGYPDPQRLSWAMEAEALGDLRHGSVQVVEGDVKVTLSIDANGEAQLVSEKNGKTLKEVPASVRKVASIVALRAQKTALGQQTSRMRRSLEESMVRGDEFTAAELKELGEHPLLRPMLRTLFFITPESIIFQGASLAENKASARIAHATDLLDSGRWPEYQRECVAASIRQPFKQAFRELYVLTNAERNQKLSSSRYEGQQVNPAQALATVGKRGWVNVPEEGLRRTFHREGISAWVTFLNGWFTPNDVDGLTVEHILFTRREDGKPVELDQINPRLFSEVMRDMDLMVSVAHRGGVDPEASASTTEMRAALIRETVALLKIDNVRLTDRHALIDGKLGSYNLHLGSGIVHCQPGGSLCILPVHSQHRGRIFLPFADDDPKTAEIVSKLLLLARDYAIQDPTILEQLS